MSIANLTESDIRVRESVIRQLDWDPEFDASAVGVTAHDGVVTLTGFIDSYAGKLAAERAAKRVRGVNAVANDIAVRLRLERTDADIAADAVRALQLRPTVPAGVKVSVHTGHVTLTGRVEWLFQKSQAEKAVRRVPGIRGVFNHIEVMPKAEERDVRRRIVQALHRSADVDAHRVAVSVTGGVAMLSGTVGSWLQREVVEQAAESAPGIVQVDNEISVASTEAAEPDADEIC